MNLRRISPTEGSRSSCREEARGKYRDVALRRIMGKRRTYRKTLFVVSSENASNRGEILLEVLNFCGHRMVGSFRLDELKEDYTAVDLAEYGSSCGRMLLSMSRRLL
jgi:hypothetical protein